MSPCINCVNKAHCKIRGGSKPCPAYIGVPIPPTKSKAKSKAKDVVFQTGVMVGREVLPFVLKAFVQ